MRIIFGVLYPGGNTMNNIVYAGNHLITLSNKQHCHSEWELVYCIGGQGRFGFGEKTLVFGAGELVIIPPQMHYTNHSDDGFTNIHLHIAEATLRFKEPMVLADDSEKHIFTAFRDAMYFFSSDIDSKQLAAFDQQDATGLEAIARIIEQQVKL